MLVMVEDSIHGENISNCKWLTGCFSSSC